LASKAMRIVFWDAKEWFWVDFPPHRGSHPHRSPQSTTRATTNSFHEKLPLLKTIITHDFAPCMLWGLFPRARHSHSSPFRSCFLGLLIHLSTSRPIFRCTSFLCWLGLLFRFVERGSIFLRNIHKLLPGYTMYFHMSWFSSIDLCLGLAELAQLTLICNCNYYHKRGLKYIKICIKNICTVFYWVSGTSFEDSVSTMTKEMTMKIWNTLKLV
jgi:hypothetical protein